MEKIFKKDRAEFVKTKLSTSKTWANAALLKIYEYQTKAEQDHMATLEHNGVGFSGTDAEILSSFATQFERRKWLSNKQQAIVMKKMKKYWRQILKVSDIQKIDRMIEAEKTAKIMNVI